MNKKINLQIGFLTLIILVAAFSRMIPHQYNFSPLAAIGLFGAAHFEKKWLAVLIPLLATWLSDVFINNMIYAQYFDGFTLFYGGFGWQYASYILIALFGVAIYTKKVNILNVIGGALGASLIFFLLSNFGVFISNPIYSKDITGLLACYTAALPFAQGTLMGNVVYSSVLFGAYYVLQQNVSFFKLRHLNYSR
ncbi:MAG: hypothetical protein P8P48_06710 [Saprospiraceae bacterium]|nr:hypothetical protein [Saprospiraceae bacterium]